MPAKADLKHPIRKSKLDKAWLPGYLQKLIQASPRRPIPKKVRPMLATLTDKAFDDPGWIFEIKWDGYRATAILNGDKATLLSRNEKSFSEKFYPIRDALLRWNLYAVLDGEIVVINQNGVPNFGALQNWRSESDGELVFYLFDVLWIDGHDLRGLTFIERRSILNHLKPPDESIRLSEGFEQFGNSIFESVKKAGLEGIIAKKKNSVYHENLRSSDWLKIKAHNRQEVVIGGYTLNEGTKKLFSSLLAGVYKNNDLIYTGKVGTGFDRQTQQDLLKKFKPLVIRKSPFKTLPDINKPSRFRPDPPGARAVWLKPRLICEVSYTEMTSDGLMRHPSFDGLRIDKQAKSVKFEKEVPAGWLTAVKKNPIQKQMIMPSNGKPGKTLLNPSEETQVKKINGHDLKFSHLSKVYWPKEKFTKRDMLNYYYNMAPFILPYLKNRPQSLNRHPNGIEGGSFYQKDVKGKAPDWTEKFAYRSEGDNREKEFLVCTDESSLLYMASLGCIEMNPWSSTVDHPDYPNWCVIDFDPDKNPFNQVIEAATVTHQVLEVAGIEGYCKTSGSTGLHIYIPMGGKYTYEESKEFARIIVQKVHDQLPRFTSIERPTANRKGKIYLDFLQNRPQATLAAPYSLRPKPAATVSAPLRWEELKKGLKLQDFTMVNMHERVTREGDIFKPVLGKGINLKKALTALGNI